MRVLITGIAHGIGKATAARLRADGAEIVGVDIGDGDWLACDLSHPEAIDALPLDGAFDALVNAAGLPPRPGSEAAVLNVNFLGLRRLTERVIPLMTTGGAIVSLASKAGAKWRENLDQVQRFITLTDPDALPGFIAAEGIDPVRSYDLSKEAVVVWSRAQTARLQKLGLRANTVSPAAVETRILDDFMTAFGDRASKGTALMGRAGTATEVAAVAAFLCHPESGWLKGVNLPVDGGLDARLDCLAFGIPEAE